MSERPRPRPGPGPNSVHTRCIPVEAVVRPGQKLPLSANEAATSARHPRDCSFGLSAAAGRARSERAERVNPETVATRSIQHSRSPLAGVLLSWQGARPGLAVGRPSCPRTSSRDDLVADDESMGVADYCWAAGREVIVSGGRPLRPSGWGALRPWRLLARAAGVRLARGQDSRPSARIGAAVLYASQGPWEPQRWSWPWLRERSSHRRRHRCPAR